MKAITIKQPWASLIVHGIKDIENRTWPCPRKYIGQRVFIHAAGSHGRKFSINLTDAQAKAAFATIANETMFGNMPYVMCSYWWNIISMLKTEAEPVDDENYWMLMPKFND